ncbi:MAG: hypothetical protein WCJ93_11820 [Methanomicrobiales archaeon]
MGRKVSLYLILGLILIGFCVAPVAASGAVALPNGDSWYEEDGNYAYYYHNDTGIWDTIHQSQLWSQGLTIHSIPKVTPGNTNTNSNSLLAKTNLSPITTKPIPTQATIKTIPAVKYEPATPVVSPTITPFTYSPTKGATTIPSIKVSNTGKKYTYPFTLKPDQTSTGKEETDFSLSYLYQNYDAAILGKIHDTTLLLLLDPNYRRTMDPDLNPIGALINEGVLINDPNRGELVIIEVYLKAGENPIQVEQYAYQVRGYYPDYNVVVATVPLNDIYAVVSLPEVLSLNLVHPGICG